MSGLSAIFHDAIKHEFLAFRGKNEKGSGEPMLIAGFFDLSRGLGVRNRSGRYAKPWKNKNLEDYPDSYNPYAYKNVVH